MPDKSAAEIIEGLEEQEATHAVARSAYRHRRTVADLRREIRELNATVDALEEDVATLEALRPTPPPPKPMPAVKGAKRAKGAKLPAAFVALASDWHTCEIVTERQTGGRNKHDQAIGTERAWRWAKGLVRMCQDEQARADVQTLVLWWGGDMLVNDGLHYKSERSCDLSPPDEARFIRDLLAQIITYVRAELDVPRIVIPTSWGNHDRSTAKMIPGHAGDYSHMQPVYRDLAAWFARDPSIEFRIAEAEWQAVDVHGYGLLFHHGHAVRYGGGVGGLAVPLGRYPTPKRIGRTLDDHHEAVESLTLQAIEAFDDGYAEVAIALDENEQLRIRRINAPAIPEECGPRLCLYWMTYYEIDRLLRRFAPISHGEPK